MCPPAALALGAAVMSATGSVISAFSARAQGKYENQLQKRNAGLERQSEQLDLDATRQEALNRYRQIAQVKGEQRASAGGGNVSVNYGTAADEVSDTTMLGREDIQNIYTQGAQKQKGHDITAYNDIAAGRAAKSRGDAAFASGLFQAGGTLLGGASQYQKLSAG